MIGLILVACFLAYATGFCIMTLVIILDSNPRGFGREEKIGFVVLNFIFSFLLGGCCFFLVEHGRL